MTSSSVVSVSGTCSRAGKTALAESVLRALPPRTAAAVKFTTTDDVFACCPRGTACTVCDIDTPYRLVDDVAVLDQPGTDTARLRLAGAREVLWVIARQAAASEAWSLLSRRLPTAGLVVLEGSTIVPTVAPALRLFVAHPFLSPRRWKPTTATLVRESDAVIVNVPRAEKRAPSAEVMAALDACGPRSLRVADVSAPLASWAPDLHARLAALAAAAVRQPAPRARPAHHPRTLSTR